tara:strand:+ start:305 stop:1600 length:1296 start_codon:yes stop_codon:yes gene_type:complete
MKTDTILTIFTFIVCLSFIIPTTLYGGIAFFRDNNWITPIEYKEEDRNLFIKSQLEILRRTKQNKWLYEGTFVLLASLGVAFVLGFLILYSLNKNSKIYNGLIPLLLIPAWIFFGIITPLSIPICDTINSNDTNSTAKMFRFDRVPLVKKDDDGNLNCVRPGDGNWFLTGILPIRDLNWIGWYNIAYKFMIITAFGYYIYHNGKSSENMTKTILSAFFLFYFVINFVLVGLGQMFISEVMWGQTGEGSKNYTVHGSNMGYFNYLYNKLDRNLYTRSVDLGEKKAERGLIKDIGDVTFVIRIIFTLLIYFTLCILGSYILPGFIKNKINYSGKIGSFFKYITIFLLILPIIIFIEMIIMPECFADKIMDHAGDHTAVGSGVNFRYYTNVYPSWRGPRPLLGFLEYIAHTFGMAGGIVAPMALTLIIYFIYFH